MSSSMAHWYRYSTFKVFVIYPYCNFVPCSGKLLATKFETVDVYHNYRYGNERAGVFSLQYNFDGTSLAVGYGNGGVDVSEV